MAGPADATRHRSFRSALLSVGLLSLLLAASALAAVGGLTQKPGTAGCISETGLAGACIDGNDLLGPSSVAVSPDGASAYVASTNSDAVAIFDRSTTTGILTQKPGTAGCISETGSAGACVDGTRLSSAASVTVSPDGTSVYTTSQTNEGGVAIFDRNTATGALTQKPGTAGCVSESGASGACVDGTALSSTESLAISPDGTNAYVATRFSNSVAVFDRSPATGALTQKPGTAGCVSNDGTAGACVDGTALDGASSVTVSPDGASVYVTSLFSGAVAIFDRTPVTGVLTQKPLTAGCISDDGTGGACVDGTALDFSSSVAISPDGSSAYVASQNTGGVEIFDRNTTTGALTQKPGTAGCISDNGTAGACVDGTALVQTVWVSISPDGASVYAAARGSDAVTIFDRNTATGALTQRAGTAGCISDSGTGGACVDGTALDDARSVTISPDGASAYVPSGISDAVAILDRDLPPETTIDSGPSGLTSDGTPTFGFSSSEGGSSFECQVDGGAFGACSGPVASHTTPALSDGSHTFAVRAIDPAANPDPTPASRALTVDTTAPETKLTKKPKKKLKTKKKKAKVAVSFSSEGLATFECELDNGDFKPCESPFSVKAKSKGGKGKKHTIEVRATDEAGNVEVKPAIAKFKLIRRG